jgi:hypothetical protein
MRYFLILYLIGLLFVSCGEESREEKMAVYLMKIGVPETAFVALLNPDYCGSCTDYSINWLTNKKTTEKKIIITTGELKEEHRFRLKEAGYTFLKGDRQMMARNGVTLSACTEINLDEGEVESMEIVK